MVLSGQNLISMIAELKQNAVVSNFALLNQNIAQQDAIHHKTNEALQTQLGPLQHQLRQVCVCSQKSPLGSTICPCTEFFIRLQGSLLQTLHNLTYWATLARNRMMCTRRFPKEYDSRTINAMLLSECHGPWTLQCDSNAMSAQNKANVIKP